MDDKKFNISLEGGGDVKTLIIREGEAQKLPQLPKAILILGTIGAIASFIEHQHRAMDKSKCHVVLDREKFTAELFADPAEPLGTIVTGKMELNPDFEEFSINSSVEKRDRASILAFLRTNRIYFPDRVAHAQLLSSIKQFIAKVDMNVKAENDSRGNVSAGIDKKVSAEAVPFDAMIEIPIFKGQAKQKFRIEICFDVTTSGQVYFWFESAEVDETMKQYIENTFDEIAALAKTNEILVIEK